VVHPSVRAEFALIHVLNWCIFALSLGAFTFLLNEFSLALTPNGAVSPRDRTRFVPFGFALFLFFALRFIGLDLVSPDLLVAALVFLNAGLACRLLRLPYASWRLCLAMGATLAIGYYAKAILFPLGIALLLVLFFTASRVTRRRLLAALAVFLLLSAPLAGLVSQRAGHPTFSDVSRLAYYWYSNRRDLLLEGWTWNGNFGSAWNDLAHPPRILIPTPRTLEFATPIPGTYPIWYEPAYWWAGLPLHFDLAQQLGAIRRSFNSLAGILGSMGGLALGALILAIGYGPRRGRSSSIPVSKLLLAWSLAACLLYSPLWIERRYLGVFPVLFWLGAFGLLVVPARRAISSIVMAALIIGLVTVTIASTAVNTLQAIERDAREKRSDDQIIADRLNTLGIGPGADLASAGADLGPYYARLSRNRVVAQIEDVDAFWRLDPAARDVVAARLGAAGIRAIVARDLPHSALTDGWIRVPYAADSVFGILPITPGKQ
jgi:hypothetical protein